MILPLLLLLQSSNVPLPDAGQKRFEACTALTKSDPEKAVAEADMWRTGGGGVPARICLGLAYVELERWGPAAATFEQAAKDAEIQRDGRAGNLWVQAGNAALAGDDPAMARGYFDRALALPVLTDEMRGEAHLDRARADVAVGNLADARVDIDAALKLVPRDPMVWLLSATLARRQSDLPRATKDIGEAAMLAPNEAPIAYEEGNIAALAGATERARSAWARAAAIAPDSDAGQAAALALKGETAPQ
ncbi:hypothetical protein ACFB49_41070 [Sphingomonas sp. DBB INV C78]|uniref:tetratricopeptide repeat protein n=1 Tax=Sphingomonas sp. DBB INV C78 TaxID=3349434 RepID=UPI0036D3EEB8